MFEGFKVVAVTPASRSRYLELLFHYIKAERDIIDEYHLWVNTADKEEIRPMVRLANDNKEFTKLIKLNSEPDGPRTVGNFYSYCRDRRTIYIRFDENIVYVHPGAVKKLIDFRLRNRQYFLVFANIINNAILSHIQQKMGNFTGFGQEAGYHSRDDLGRHNGRFAAFVHDEFLKKRETQKTDSFLFNKWELARNESISPNCFAWFGEDFAKYEIDGRGKYPEEEWLGSELPRKLELKNCICGGALVCHYAFKEQIEYIDNKTNIFREYRKAAFGEGHKEDEKDEDKITPEDDEPVEITPETEIKEETELEKQDETEAEPEKKKEISVDPDKDEEAEKIKEETEIEEHVNGPIDEDDKEKFSEEKPENIISEESPKPAPPQIPECYRPVDISPKEAEDAIFCFAGEFGYEIISWIPYLLFLRNKLGIKLKTLSRPGSAPLYYFSGDHTELDASDIGDVWGHPTKYAAIAARFPDRLLIYPGPDIINRRQIIVGGYEWTTKYIHTKIDKRNYELPDYSDIDAELPFGFDRPFVVINNKYFLQWRDKYDKPVNFLSPEELQDIRDCLLSAGFAVVYNHFKEKTFTDVHLELKDRGIFGGNVDYTYDMRDFYSRENDLGMRNQIQISMYNRAAFVIGVQGGNVYLPALCEKDILMLMRHGDYVDYSEFARLFDIRMELFYEGRHLVYYLEKYIAEEFPEMMTSEKDKQEQNQGVETEKDETGEEEPASNEDEFDEKELSELEKAYSDDPGNRDNTLNFATALEKRGEFQEAEKVYLFYSMMNPGDKEIERKLDDCSKRLHILPESAEEPEMPKVSFIMIVLNGMPFVEFALRSIYDFAHEIIIVEGAVEKCMFAANEDGSSRDGTVEAINAFHDPEGKIKLIQGRWQEKLQMQNKALEQAGGDYVWLIDSDEVYRTNDIIKMLNLLAENPEISQVNFIPDNFWKGFDHIFISKRFSEPNYHYKRIFKYVDGASFISHRPIVMKHPGSDKTTEQMNLLDGYATRKMDIIPFHYSYVCTEQVNQKIQLYKQYGWDKMWNTDLDEWYSDFFLKWSPENRLELEKRYGPWTGDVNSMTIKFEGIHPEVMHDFIEEFRSTQKTAEKKHPNGKRVKIAGEVQTDRDLTAVSGDSEFQKSIMKLFRSIRPRKIIETGTYIGTGTTSIICRALDELNIKHSKFCSIEVNPMHFKQAQHNLAQDVLAGRIFLLNGLSVPRKMLPTINEIRQSTVENIEYEDIFVDHKEHERAIRYFQETDFSGMPDDMLGSCLEEFGGRPDFVLLDSAGHMGYIEFKYLVSKLKGPCYIALDDIYHIKHHKSFLEISEDPRFEVIVSSREKFGFCIAKYTPEEALVPEKQKLLWIRPDSIGDAILSFSMMPHIRSHFGDYEITAVCKEHLAELYHKCPHIDHVISFNDRRAESDEIYRNTLLEHLKSQKAELALNSVWSRTALADLLALESGAKEKIAIIGDKSNMPEDAHNKNNQLYDRLIDSPGEQRSELARHRDFLTGLQIRTEKLMPLIWTSEEDEKYADEFFEHYKLTPEKTIALFAGAQFDVRIYRHYGEALSAICAEMGFSVISLGSDREKAINRKCLSDIDARGIDLSGKTTLLQSSAIIRRCRLAVGAETGLAHIACAVGTDNVILLGGGHFGRFMPYSGLTSVAAVPLECYGCNWECRFQRPYCIKDLPLKILEFAIRKSIEGQSDKPRIFIPSEDEWNKVYQTPRWKSPDEFVDINSVEIITVDTTGERTKDKPADEIIKCSDKDYLVSAIVSAYNSEKYFRGCLEDLEAQTIADRMQIIVVDSGSQENERAIVEEFRKVHDNILYMRTEERETIYTAWNRAAKAASGKYITNANTDDRHRPDFMDIMSRALEKYPQYGLIYADSFITQKENDTFLETEAKLRYEWPDFTLGMALSTSPFGSQPVWRREIHDAIGYFNPDLTIAGDLDFFCRAAHRFGAVHLRETLGLFLQREESLSGSSNKAKTINEVSAVLRELRQYIPLTDIYSSLIEYESDPSAVAAVLWDFGNLCLLSPYNDFNMAVEMYKKAMSTKDLNQELRTQIPPLFYNNAGVIFYCAGQKEKARELLQKNASKNPQSEANLRFMEKHDRTGRPAAPIMFSISELMHPVVERSRMSGGLYLDEPGEIKMSPKAGQEFWDVYKGPNGVEVKEDDRQKAKKVIPPAKSETSRDNNKSANAIEEMEISVTPAVPRKPRILFTMFGWKDPGGGTMHPRAVARRLQSKGCEIAVFYTGVYNPLILGSYQMEKRDDDGIMTYGVYNRAATSTDEANPLREIRDDKVVRLFEKVIDEFKPDLVHFHNFLGLSFAIAATASAKGIPTLYTPHNYHIIDPRLYMFSERLTPWKNVDFFENSILAKTFPGKSGDYQKRIDEARKVLNEYIGHNLAISTRVRQLLIDFGCKPENVSVVHQIPHTIEGLSKPQYQREIKKPLRIGFMGEVLSHKGLHKLISAAQRIPAEDAVFNVYGRALTIVKNKMQEFDRGRIMNWMGPYKPEDLKRIGNEIDLMVFPSIWEEGAGLVILEAFALGLPVIGAKIGGIPDFIEDKKTGRLYRFDSDRELAGIITELANSPDEIAAMRKNLNIPYSFDDYVSHLAKIYTRLIESGAISSSDATLLFRDKIGE